MSAAAGATAWSRSWWSGTAFGPGAGFEGCVADLSLYGAAISAADAQKAWIPGPISFCPEYAAIPAVTTICQGQTSRQVCFTICNNNATAQTYQWSLAGLPAGPGCNVAGPTQFSPVGTTVGTRSFPDARRQ